MAIFAGLFAFLSRFVGKALTTTLGWASTLLFGRVPADRQFLLLAITLGSVLWMVLLAGVLVPAIGTFLLVLLPGQDILPDDAIRLIMLVLAAVVPAIVGGLTVLLAPKAEPEARRIAEAVVRGYPLTALLAVLLVFLAGLAVVRKGRSLTRGWTDAHVPFVVDPGRYDEVADDLARAVTAAGLDVTPSPAPAAMSKPARWLAAVAGSGAASLVPERMIQLDGDEITILIYPMDLLISGKPGPVARARAAMASRLTTSSAHLTVSAESQEVEDRLRALAHPSADDPERERPFDREVAAELAEIDRDLATLEVPYDEWETLYRQRLQVERDLRAGTMAGEAVVGASTPGVDHDGALGLLGELGRLARDGAGVVADVATDERTAKAFDRAAGAEWRWAARIGSVAVAVASAARGAGEPSPEDGAEPPTPRTDDRVAGSDQRPASAP